MRIHYSMQGPGLSCPALVCVACFCIISAASNASAQSSGSSDSSNPDFADLVKATINTVSSLRELELKRPVEWRLVDSEMMAGIMMKTALKIYSEGEIEAEGDLYKRLGLIPDAMNYKDEIFALLKEQVAGLYEPEDEILYINRDMDADMEETTLAHELAHALVDQQHDLDGLLDRKKTDGDHALAASALIEGDAILLTLKYMIIKNIMPSMDEESMGMWKELQKAPPFIVDSLLFAYTNGLMFVNSLMKNPGDWKTVDGLYERVPVSTEHIMHPQKYVSGDLPVEIVCEELPVLRGKYTAVHDEVLGEFTLMEYLKTFSSPDANDAAEGWGGDRAVLFRPVDARDNDSDMLVSMSVWDAGGLDGMNEARDFAEALKDAAMKRYRSQADECESSGTWLIPAENGNLSLVSRQGSRVVWIDNVPAGMAHGVLLETLARCAVKKGADAHPVPLM